MPIAYYYRHLHLSVWVVFLHPQAGKTRSTRGLGSLGAPSPQPKMDGSKVISSPTLSPLGRITWKFYSTSPNSHARLSPAFAILITQPILPSFSGQSHFPTPLPVILGLPSNKSLASLSWSQSWVLGESKLGQWMSFPLRLGWGKHKACHVVGLNKSWTNELMNK